MTEQIKERLANKESAQFKIKFDESNGLWFASDRTGKIVIKNAHYFTQCVAAVSRDAGRKGMPALYPGKVEEQPLRKALSDLGMESIYIQPDDTGVVFKPESKPEQGKGGGHHGK